MSQERNPYPLGHPLAIVDNIVHDRHPFDTSDFDAFAPEEEEDYRY